jgi:hypothetical protein
MNWDGNVVLCGGVEGNFGETPDKQFSSQYCQMLTITSNELTWSPIDTPLLINQRNTSAFATTDTGNIWVTGGFKYDVRTDTEIVPQRTTEMFIKGVCC